METIRNYLETMFSNLPNTPEIQKAKYELWQMMEDKYTELIQQGKTDNEAVGIVISEFGNLDDLAEDLGIGSFMKHTSPDFNRRNVTQEEAVRYLASNGKHAYMIALGVLLCIISPITVIFMDAVASHNGIGSRAADAIGITALFGCVALAVGLFIFAGITGHNWDYLKNQPCSIDFATSKFVHDRRESYKLTHALLLTIGVVLCIISVVPSAVIDSLTGGIGILEEASGVFVLLMVAIGVFMIVLTSIRAGGFTTLLNLNNSTTVGGNFVPSQKNHARYSSPTVAAIMSVFWPTVTCIYLCWSFLTFDWFITWIIWPVAAIIETLIKSTLAD